MANYVCVMRSNYFRVKDPDAFRSFMAEVKGNEEKPQLWEKPNENGEIYFGFGAYGGINGYYPTVFTEEEAERLDEPFEAFLFKLQEHVADDDAIIIMESGHEILRYVVGTAVIITAKDIQYLDVARLAQKQAAKILEDENFQWFISTLFVLENPEEQSLPAALTLPIPKGMGFLDPRSLPKYFAIARKVPGSYTISPSVW